MSGEEILYISLMIGLPALFVLIGFPILKSRNFTEKYNKTIQISYFNKHLIIKKSNFIILIFLIAMFGWLDFFLPLYISLAIFFIALSSFSLFSTKVIDPDAIPDTTKILIDNLSSIEKSIENVRQHISLLQENLYDTQQEVDKKLKIKQELENQIQNNKLSADTWSTMTQNQKDTVSNAAVNAISIKMKGQFWYGLILGFIINILAAFAWALIGNPSKDDILKNLINTIHALF